MNFKDVITQSEKLREEWDIEYGKNAAFEGLDMSPKEIADWWLSKYSSYTKDLLQSVVDTCCNDCKDSIQLRNVIKELQK